MTAMCVLPPAQASPSGALELALYRPYQWPPEHRTVTVRFLDGGPTQHTIVRVLVEGAWNRASGLQFAFVDGPADVRITFQGVGNWCYPGTYGLALPQEEETMCLSGVRQDSTVADIRRIVLHEFGHACGYLHEQQSPNAEIPWDVPAVYAYYRARGWDKTMTDSQVLARTGEEVAEAGSYDFLSVMHYHIPAELVLDRVARGGSDRLSAGDVAMARHWYGDPPAVPEPPPVEPPKWSWFIPYVATEEE